MGDGLGRDAAAGVNDGQPPAVPGVGADQTHGIAGGAGVQGVHGQVAQQVRQQHPVGLYRGPGGGIKGERCIGQAAGNVVEHGGDVNSLQRYTVLLQPLQGQ